MRYNRLYTKVYIASVINSRYSSNIYRRWGYIWSSLTPLSSWWTSLLTSSLSP